MMNIKTITTIVILLVSVAFVPSCMGSEDLVTEITLDEDEQLAGSNDIAGIEEKLIELEEETVASPVLLSPSPNEKIYSGGDKALIFIKGTAEDDCSIEVYVDEILQQSGVTVDSDGKFETLNGVEISEGNNIIKLVAIGPTGQKSKPTQFNLHLKSPEKVSYDVYENSEDLKEIEDFYYVETSNPVAYIKGSYQPGSQVYLQVNDVVTGESAIDSSGIFSFSDVNLDLGDNEIAIWAVTSDGLAVAPAFKNILVTKDVESPYPISLSGFDDSEGNHLSWSLSADENFSSYKLIRVEDPCVNPELNDDVIETFSDPNTDSYTDVDIEQGKSYSYTLWVLDKAGHRISSNVLDIPKPEYAISIEKVGSFDNTVISRREWYYQYYEITNKGNVTINIQPIMVYLLLDPEPDAGMELFPLWEVHIWNPETSEYYYSNEEIYSTYIADYMNVDGTTNTEVTTEYSDDGLTRTDTETTTTKFTYENEGKRVMKTTVDSTTTETNLTTGVTTIETSTDVYSDIVEPELIGTPIEGVEPGQKVKIAVKIQNIYADDNEDQIIAHFHFAPVDCSGCYFTDEKVSTGDIIVTSTGRE